MVKNRIEWVDYLKAFTCFLVIFGHLIQSLIKAGIDPIVNANEFINYFIYLFHMPLFMCISGILYFKTKREFSWDNYKKFELKKILDLGIPYFTFYIIYMLMNTIFSNSVNTAKGIKEWLGILNNPIPPYWFLYALLSIFIVIPLIDKIIENKKLKLGLFIILKLISIEFSTKIYFIDSIMKWGIYFYLGNFIVLNKNSKKLSNIFYSIIYIIISLAIYTIKPNVNNYIYGIISIILAIAGTILMINIFRSITKSKILDTYKNYTMQIFLTHTIFAAAFRILLFKFNIRNYIIHLIFGIFASIYIPVIMSKISEKLKWTEFFFYPTKTIKAMKEGS